MDQSSLRVVGFQIKSSTPSVSVSLFGLLYVEKDFAQYGEDGWPRGWGGYHSVSWYVNAWNRLPRGGVMLGRFAWVPHSGLS
jgi:hypothetical protein